MDFKKIVVILCVSIAILVGIIFGSSYAWYAYKNAESTVGGSTIKERPTIIFSQTEYIFSKEIMPISDADRYNYANKNSFTVTIGEDLRDYETGIEISLKDITISNELKNSNYKYELLQDGFIVSTGDFGSLGNENSLKIMPMRKMIVTSYPTTYSYELYIWLSDDGSNQNDLMGKIFSAKVNVNSATKK